MYFLAYYVLPSVVICYAIRKYRQSKWGKCTNNVQLDGKTVIVTGANSGIGLELALQLASRKAQVILACRNLNKANVACDYIKSKIANTQLIPMELDLSSLKSVKSFADHFKKNYEKIDILINNAGVSYPNNKRMKTEDGFEIHFGVNHLGHFYLTNLLLEPLKKTQSRIVVIASSLHERGEINLNDLNSESAIKKSKLYADSKLANVYFAQELAKRLKLTTVKVYACCPGWIYTNLFRHSVKWYHYILVAPIALFFMRSVKEGAQTPLYCATEPKLLSESGLLYRDCGHYNSKAIFYENVSNKLWEESEKMVKSVIGEENHF